MISLARRVSAMAALLLCGLAFTGAPSEAALSSTPDAPGYVVNGSVTVRDFRRRKSLPLRAPRKYIAQAAKRRA